MKDVASRLTDDVDWISAPESTTSWRTRAWWEYTRLPALATSLKADVYFTPSGVAAAGLRIPQVVFCQNPWALVPEARRRRDGCKAWLQRSAYRHAMKAAEVMVFNSTFMQEAYRMNAGFMEKRGLVVYQAADEATIAQAVKAQSTPRVPGRIVCASAMGRHKNVETTVRAVARLHREGCTIAHLLVIGGWPDPSYRGEIETLVRSLGIGHAVTIMGHVAREVLDECYASAMAFCLMSRCESFGIPAIEAQLFGTPVVSSDVCAIPEVCGDGGMFVAPDDDAGTASALRRLLQDPDPWAWYSQAARTNARRFEWSRCSTPLVELFERWSPS